MSNVKRLELFAYLPTASVTARPARSAGTAHVLPILGLLIIACGEGGGDAPPVIVRDSSGIEIVESAGAAATITSLDTLPFVEIGPEVVGGEHLYRVVGVERLADGRLVVANAGSQQLMVFDRDGSFASAIGGPGDGPGEFGAMYGLFACGNDTLVVNEGRRVSFLDGSGRFLRQTPVLNVTDASERLEGVSADCSRLLLLGGDPLLPPYPAGVYQQEYRLRWRGLDAGVAESVIEFRGPDRVTLDAGIGAIPQMVPWGSDPVWTVRDEFVYLGTSEHSEVLIFGATGRPERIVRWSMHEVPVTAADRQRYADRRAELIEADPRQAQIVPQLEDYSNLPEHKPAYSQLLVDDQYRLWVREYPASLAGRRGLFDTRPGDQPVMWWVFDATGRLVNMVRIPANMKVVEVDDGHLIGVWFDLDNVEHVRLYRLGATEIES